MENGKSVYHKVHQRKLNSGQKAADLMTKWIGSWWFIVATFWYIFVWAGLNTYFLVTRPWDPYPFILLNLTLSCLAALHAPIILMSQNRQAEKDRQRLEFDYLIDKKSENEIKKIQLDVLEIKEILLKKSMRGKSNELREEIKKLEHELQDLENSMR